MKIVAFNSSPRKSTGNTHIMVEEILKGAASAGAVTENIFLADKNIKYCRGCFNCWTKSPGKCVINDDMGVLIEKFINADVVILATPLYVDNVSGPLKMFLDRLIPIVDPYFEKDENGETRHRTRFEKYPKFVIVSNCGFPEQSHFQIVSSYFKRVARNSHSTIIAEIYRGEGELLRNKSLLLFPVIYRYKRSLRKAGEEIVKNGFLSEQLKKSLEKPLISVDLYYKKANENWDKTVKNIK